MKLVDSKMLPGFSLYALFFFTIGNLLVGIPLCWAATIDEVIRFRADPDQVLVLYNADWTEDATGTERGQDSLELAEYYQLMHTDSVTGKKPFLLPLSCVHGDKHLNNWYIKEQSTDNKNAIFFTGVGQAPEDYNWALDSQNVEVTVPEKNTDWDSVTIRVRSDVNGTIKTVYARSQSLEGVEIKVSGVPQRKPLSRTYPPIKEGEGRCFRFDVKQVFNGTTTVFLKASDKEGREITDISVRYFDQDEFVFTPTGPDGIADDKFLEEDVLQPVRTYLEDPTNALADGRLLKDHILYIVLVRGLPYAANGVFGIEHGATNRKADHGSLTSLDQRLQTLYYPWGTKIRPPVTSMFLSGGPQSSSGVGSYIISTVLRYPLSGVRWNPYLHPDTYSFLKPGKKAPPNFYPVAPFADRRKRLTDNFHAFSVTRIDGETIDDSKRLIDYTIYANRYLRPEMDCSVRKRLEEAGLIHIGDLSDRMQAISKKNLWGVQELEALGFSNISKYQQGLPFLVLPTGATAGECGNDTEWGKSGFYPGGMHIQVVSSNGLNSKKAPVWKMLGQGVTVTSAGSPAYDGGPHITNATFWDNRIVIRYLLRGKDLGESLLLSNYYINWSTSFIGDPLLHPDLNETVIDTLKPSPKGKLHWDLQRNGESYTAIFSAELNFDQNFPEVAALRVHCSDLNSEEISSYSVLFERLPRASLTGLAPQQEYHCTAVLADPYDNLTAMGPVTIHTGDVSSGERLKDSLIDFIKGIELVDPKKKMQDND